MIPTRLWRRVVEEMVERLTVQPLNRQYKEWGTRAYHLGWHM